MRKTIWEALEFELYLLLKEGERIGTLHLHPAGTSVISS